MIHNYIYFIYVYVIPPLRGIYPISPHQARGQGEYKCVPSDGGIIHLYIDGTTLVRMLHSVV